MSSKHVTDYNPNMNEIKKWPGRGVAITGLAPPDSGFDFFTRLFSPNFGIDEVIPTINLLNISFYEYLYHKCLTNNFITKLIIINHYYKNICTYMQDQVCGSIHCAVAPYWSKKLGKSNLKAYMVGVFIINYI